MQAKSSGLTTQQKKCPHRKMTLHRIKAEVEKVLPDSKHISKMMVRALWLASQGTRVHLVGYTKTYTEDLQRIAQDLCKRCGIDPKWILKRRIRYRDEDAMVIEDQYRPGLKVQ
jgi:hypothetical protein